MRIATCLPFLLLAPVLGAQSVVSPAHWTNAEGPSYDSQGIGTTSTPARYLAIHDDMAGTPRMISSVAFRRDGSVGATTNHIAYSTLVDIFISTSSRTSATPATTFAQNHGTDKVQVGQFKLVQFAASPAGGLVRDFDFVVPFTTPFMYGGTGPLCYELTVTSRTNTGTIYFDWANSSSTNPAAQTDTIGTGCISTGQTSAIAMTGSSSPNWTQSTMNLTYSAQRMPKSALVTLMLGTTTTNFSGVPLPFELPGTAAAPSKACTLLNNAVLQIPQLTNASGAMSAQFAVSVNPAFNGANLYAQVVAIDAPANPWGLVLSNSVQHNIVAPYGRAPIGDVYATNLSGTGTARANAGFIVKFN